MSLWWVLPDTAAARIQERDHGSPCDSAQGLASLPLDQQDGCRPLEVGGREIEGRGMQLTGGDASGGGQRTLPPRMDEALPGADAYSVETSAEEGAYSSHPLQGAPVLVGLSRRASNVGPTYIQNTQHGSAD